VSVVRVDGVDPLGDPARYPLRVSGSGVPAAATTVSVVGDIMLARRVGASLRGDFARPLRPMAPRLAAADLTIGNLESTLSRLGPRTQGDDSFGADPRALAGLKLAGFDVLSLGNNHVGDYGDQSLVETRRLVTAGGFVPVGAGRNHAEAWKPAIVSRDGVRFGIVAFNAIGETKRATATRPGAASVRMEPRTGPLNAADVALLRSTIAALRPSVDVVLVMPQWGTQYTHVQVPDQHTVGKAAIDAGADLVIGGHPHWVQGVEVYKGRLIVHSLANFVFDMDWEDEVREGVVLELTYWGSVLKAARFVPYRISTNTDFAPRVVSWENGGAEILSDLWSTSGAPFRLPN
jgi:poly-gamma-glutamate synthesis protein (capsule biosynthesis protein)